MTGTTSAPEGALPARLVVTKPFGDYARGAVITDAKVIEQIWMDGQRSHVVPTAALLVNESAGTEHSGSER